MRVTTKLRTWVALLALAALHVTVLALPAAAACHVAAFEQTEVSVDEGAGQVELTIFLQGRQPNCAGSVDWVTEDGTATAGEDYEASEGTAVFEEGDDREETIVIPILADDGDRGDETFTVRLQNAEGIGTSDTPATVTIVDAGGGDGEPTEAPTEEPTPEPTPQPTAGTGPDGDEADADGNPIVPIVVVLLVLGIGGAVLFSRRNA